MALGVVGGAALGVLANLTLGGHPWLEAFVTYGTQPLGQIYLRLLLMLVIPLLFAALALGVAGMGDLGKVGRIGVRTLAYTVIVSAIAVGIGLLLVNLLRPGDGISEELRARLTV